MGCRGFSRPAGALLRVARTTGPAALTLAVGAALTAVDSAAAQTRAASSVQYPAASPGPLPLPTDRVEYVITTATPPVEVDGVMDDRAWREAVAIPLAWEVAPGDNVASPVATECRLAYDEDHLYLGCVASDPEPSAIRAYVTDRDAITGQDRILLTIDPFNDQRRAFQFGVSALGVQYDAVLAQQGTGGMGGSMSSDASWDAIWSSAGTITERGYVVEAAIPFRSLRFPDDADGTPWGAYLARWWPRSSNVEMRSAPWNRSESCMLCQANLVTGVRDVSPGANLELAPTVTASKVAERTGAHDDPFVGEPVDGEVGLDARWGVTSDLALNVTVNPDFSQIEADVAQLDVNTRFALFFPEKRPFFLEGADFFGTPIRAVFTRSISDPIAGAKLTGKLGASALGLLVARDRSTTLLIPGSESSTTTAVDQPVTTAVGRYRRDVGGSSTVGVLTTVREGADYHNRVAGVDALIRPAGPLTIETQVLGTETAYPAGVSDELAQPTGAFGGWAAMTTAQWTTRDWSLWADARVLNEGFRADAGFQSQAGVRGGSLSATRRFWGSSDRWYTQLRVEGGLWHNRDEAGNQLNGGVWFGLGYQGPGQTSISLWPNLFMSEHFDGVTYHGMNQLWFDLSSAPTGGFTLGVNGDFGDVVDFANGRLGSELRLAPRLDTRLGRHFQLGLDHTWLRLGAEGAEVFTANLSQMRAVYSFTPRMFVRAILQYRHTRRNPQAYVDEVGPRSTGLLAQGLFAYKVNPQTVVFVGYGEDGAGRVRADGVREPFVTRGRALFLKLGYAWRP